MMQWCQQKVEMLTRLADDEMQVTTSSTYCEHHTFEHQLFNKKDQWEKNKQLKQFKAFSCSWDVCRDLPKKYCC